MDFRTVYFELWQKSWAFHKKWFNNSGTDSEWQGIVDESHDILKEYENTPEYNFMKDLLLAVLSELERIDKQKRGK